MKRHDLLAIAVMGFAVGAWADVLESNIVGKNVLEGTTETISERLTLPDGAVMVKTGEGKLVLPNSVIDQRQTLRIQVDEGTLELDSDEEGSVSAAELSDAVKAKLALWLSAKDAAHLVSGENGVAAWYDVRETDTSNPSFPYAETSTLTSESGPVLKTGEYISRYSTKTNKMNALYFGGLGSGIAMHILNRDGTAFSSLPFEMAAVHGVVDTWGYLFGTAQTSGKTIMEGDDGDRTPTSADTTGYGWRHCWGAVMGDAKIWVDGIEVDRADPVDPGFHLVHRRRNSVSVRDAVPTLYAQNQAIFSGSAKDGSDATKNFRGGDYIGEIMYFSETLTQAERMEVQNYLMRKWFGKQRGTTEVTLTGNGNLLVDVPSAEERNLDFAVRGNGTFVKTGAGALVYRPSACLPGDPATVRIEGGKVFTMRDLPVSVEKGDEIVAMREEHEFSVDDEPLCVATTAVSRATADAADKIVKSGDSFVAIRSIPSGTARLEIEDGTLSVRASAAALPVKYEVPIVNSGFETWSGDGSDKASMPVCEGWTRTAGGAHFYDYVRWSAATVKDECGSLGALITAYNLDAVPPPGGSRAMTLKGANIGAYTTVEIPEDGEYEFNFMMYNRPRYGANCRLAVTLKDTSGREVLADFGEVNQVQTETFRQHALRAMVPKGTYRLYLENRPYAGWVKETNNLDMMLVIDDVRLHRVGDWKRAWKLPGGDFEAVTGCTGMKTGSLPILMDSKYGVDGWTFRASEYDGNDTTDTPETYPTVGVVNPKMRAESGRYYGNGYNGKNRPLGGEYQLLFRHPNSDNQATVSFTPPKGRWYLACRAGLWADYDNPRLNASIASGETTLEIGDIHIINEYGLNPYVWPVAFEADGVTPVTLTLSYLDEGDRVAYHGVLADDFQLVGEFYHALEIIRNGDFERPSIANGRNPGARAGGWQSLTVKDSEGKTVGGNNLRGYGLNDAKHFGGDYASGDIYTEIYRIGCLYQDVVMPAAGWYRFTGLFKGRIYRDKRFDPLAIELVDVETATTNRIGLVDEACAGTFEERSFYFHVPAAGEYRVLFRGLKASESFCIIDDVSIRYVSMDGLGAAFMPEDLRISVSEGAALQLDYTGACTVKSFRSNGRTYRGLVDSSVCPEISGPGALLVKGDGLVLVIK